MPITINYEEDTMKKIDLLKEYNKVVAFTPAKKLVKAAKALPKVAKKIVKAKVKKPLTKSEVAVNKIAKLLKGFNKLQRKNILAKAVKGNA